MRPIAAATLGGLAAFAMAAAARAEAPADPPALALRIQETTDLWRDASGGKRPGDAAMEKLDLEADWSGAAAGLVGWSARFRVIATNKDFFSARHVGDIQTLSNIEGDGYLHAFEMWGQKAWGDKGSLRAGFLDLNADFDSIRTAGLFLNSSHGIGPDLSESAIAGPSIFPVTALGVRGQWTPDKAWTLSLGVFDGLPGQPGHPGTFASTYLSSREGATVIGEADRRFGQGWRAGLGVWAYTAGYALIGAPGQRQDGQAGAYGFVEGPIPGASDVSGWVRVGHADGQVNIISSYAGAGLVFPGSVIGRADDHFGFAVARAGFGAPARQTLGLGRAETSLEATYQGRAFRWLTLQPDVQYILDPGGRYRNALALGLRIVVTGRRPDPGGPTDADPADATSP